MLIFLDLFLFGKLEVERVFGENMFLSWKKEKT